MKTNSFKIQETMKVKSHMTKTNFMLTVLIGNKKNYTSDCNGVCTTYNH